VSSRVILGTPSIYEITFDKSIVLPIPSIILHRFYDTAYIFSFRAFNFRGEWKLIAAISSKNIRQPSEKPFLDHVLIQFPLTDLSKLCKFNMVTISFLKASARLFKKDPIIVKLTLREAENIVSKLFDAISGKISVHQTFIGGPIEIAPQINLSSHVIESKTYRVSSLPQIEGESMLGFTSSMNFKILSTDSEPYIAIFIKWSGKKRFGSRCGLISMSDWNKVSTLAKNVFSLLLLSFKLRGVTRDEVTSILGDIGRNTEEISNEIFNICEHKIFRLKQTSIKKFLE